MNADYGLIGKQISFYRHQVGLTQEQLAEACNLSVSYLNRIENGRKKASLDVLITIADTLGSVHFLCFFYDLYKRRRKCNERE